MPAKRKKRGPKSFLSQKKLFRRAGYEAKLRHEVDVNKSNEVVKSYRKGYNLMWKFAPKDCERLKFPKPGTFSKYNGHDGRLWGYKKECNMTDIKAGKILLALIRSRKLTMPQLELVRKSLAYSYQLMGNRVTKYQKNWAEVTNAWKAVNGANCVPTKSNKPTLIPTPEELKTAFTSRWNPAKNKMSFLKSVIGRRAAFDVYFSGHRPHSDIRKLKKSRDHKLNVAEGWLSTGFTRSKLSGPKKNSRKWRQWAVCWCKNGKHASPTLAQRFNLDDAGNPRNGDPGFDDRCIVAGFQFTSLWSTKKKWRRYPNLAGSGRGKSQKGQIGNADTGSVSGLAREWLADNGLGPYDGNAGRKAYAGLLDHLNIPYEWGFENHGDNYATWEQSYQPGCRRENDDFKRRDQSKNFKVATRALRQISQWMELGSKKPVRQMSLLERQNDMLLRGMGLSSQADKILLGLNAAMPEPQTVKPESVEPAAVKPEPAGQS